MPELGAAIAHLREVLGNQTYNQLADSGAAMNATEVTTHAYAQIDRTRTELA